MIPLTMLLIELQLLTQKSRQIRFLKLKVKKIKLDDN